MPMSRTMSLKTTPPRRLRRPQTPPSLVQKLDWVFTQKPRATGLSLEDGALSRESDTRGRRRHTTRRSLTRAFARSNNSCCKRSPQQVGATPAAASAKESPCRSIPPPAAEASSHCRRPHTSAVPAGVARAGLGISPAAAASGFHALESRPTPGRLADTAASHPHHLLLLPSKRTTTVPCHERRSRWPPHHHGAAPGAEPRPHGAAPPTRGAVVEARPHRRPSSEPRKSLPRQSPAPRLAADPGRGRPDPASGSPDLPPQAATVAMAGVRAALLHRPGESASGRKGPAAVILGACAGLPASPSGSGREGGGEGSSGAARGGTGGAYPANIQRSKNIVTGLESVVINTHVLPINIHCSKS
jgi:hypothetical protein